MSNPRFRPWIFVGAILLAAILGYPVLKALSIYSRVTGDPRLQMAKQARSRMPEFREALANHQPGYRFAIKGRFITDMGPEYLWLKDPQPTDDGFSGILDQDPIAVKQSKKGDRVTVTNEQIVDWMIREPSGNIRGGFTEKP